MIKTESPVFTGSITFQAGAGQVKLNPDGTVELTEGVDLDEAASALWKAVEKMRPKAPAVAWRWPNIHHGNFLESNYVYLDNGAPDCPEDCEALFLSPSDERKKALREVVAMCEMGIEQNQRAVAEFAPTEFAEQLIMKGAIFQAERIRDAAKDLLERS